MYLSVSSSSDFTQLTPVNCSARFLTMASTDLQYVGCPLLLAISNCTRSRTAELQLQFGYHASSSSTSHTATKDVDVDIDIPSQYIAVKFQLKPHGL